MSKQFGGEFGATLEELKALLPHTTDVSGLTFEGPAQKVGAFFKLVGMAGDLIEEIERLQALEQSVERMAQMLNDREWAEHVGVGVASDLENAITTMHNELAAEQQLADRYRAGRAIATDDEFVQAMAPVMQEHPLPAPNTGENYDNFMDVTVERAKEAGLWPIKGVLH